MVFADGHKSDLERKLSEMHGGEVVLNVVAFLQTELLFEEGD